MHRILSCTTYWTQQETICARDKTSGWYRKTIFRLFSHYFTRDRCTWSPRDDLLDTKILGIFFVIPQKANFSWCGCPKIYGHRSGRKRWSWVVIKWNSKEVKINHPILIIPRTLLSRIAPWDGVSAPSNGNLTADQALTLNRASKALPKSPFQWSSYS